MSSRAICRTSKGKDITIHIFPFSANCIDPLRNPKVILQCCMVFNILESNGDNQLPLPRSALVFFVNLRRLIRVFGVKQQQIIRGI